MRNYVKEELEGEKKKGIQLSPFDMKIYHKLNMLKDINPEKTNSTRDIRKLLHPTLRDDQLPTKDRNSHIKMSTLFSSKKKLKVPSKFYSRFVEFKKLPPSDFETPIIGNDSPYITEEDLKRKEYLQSKKGWISPETFRSYFSKATKSDNFIENYVTMTPSDPPILHKFRSAKKEDWLSHDFKF
uniref:Uncharacterized protein n=1 Tax=Euplotes crassus TaxID=5936 RepID=A0A7S3KB94_EUPCR|mmetsp:Transcript_14571/g.14523  ORF Transcript_14571/g.14523 Transcript_14571/m.14523 type:complete len:184 (+) Transcript_14571:1011-1562(+)